MIWSCMGLMPLEKWAFLNIEETRKQRLRRAGPHLIHWHHDPQSPESKTMRNGFLEFIKGLVCDNLLLQSK